MILDALILVCSAAVGAAGWAQSPVLNPKQALEQARKAGADIPPVRGGVAAQDWERDPFAKAAVEEARRLLAADADRLAGRALKPEQLPPVLQAWATQETAMVRFGPQTHQGISIDGTEITVVLRTRARQNTHSISGRWVTLPADLPTKAKVAEKDARRSLLGQRLNVSDVASEPSWITLAGEHLKEAGELAYIIGDKAAGPRLAWRIQTVPWIFWVDAETGKILKKFPAF